MQLVDESELFADNYCRFYSLVMRRTTEYMPRRTYIGGARYTTQGIVRIQPHHVAIYINRRRVEWEFLHVKAFRVWRSGDINYYMEITYQHMDNGAPVGETRSMYLWSEGHHILTFKRPSRYDPRDPSAPRKYHVFIYPVK